MSESWMRMALREARRGVGRTSPNPAVGAVIVSARGRLLAKSWHRGAGCPHAEVEAISKLARPSLARGATLYVTLEPCSTHGRTPPCVDGIVQAGFAKVVVAAVDPNPAHAGRGLKLLRAAGIEVASGMLAGEATALNRGFNKWIVTGMPLVIAKCAMSLDGRISRPPGQGQWLSSARSRADAHKLRAQVDAILIGAGTLRADNPRLTVRNARGIPARRQPWRVVVSRSSNLPDRAYLFTDEFRDRTLVFKKKSLAQVLRELGARGVTSVLIEGGSQMLTEAFARRLADRIHFYVAPLIIGGSALAFDPGKLIDCTIENPEHRSIGGDVLLTGDVRYADKRR